MKRVVFYNKFAVDLKTMCSAEFVFNGCSVFKGTLNRSESTHGPVVFHCLVLLVGMEITELDTT